MTDPFESVTPGDLESRNLSAAEASVNLAKAHITAMFVTSDTQKRNSALKLAQALLDYRRAKP